MNIHEYIQTQQYDIEELDISNKKLTEIPDLTRFYKLVKATSCNFTQCKVIKNAWSF